MTHLHPTSLPVAILLRATGWRISDVLYLKINSCWIEINHKNLQERVGPAIAMLKQGQTVAKSEKDEREYTQEEWEQRQHQPQEKIHE